MPIRIPDHLPAAATLEKENVFVMPENRAFRQDIRPLNLLILNLMPTKIATETQLLRNLSNSPLQVHIDLLYTASYQPKNTSEEHLLAFYETFEDVKDRRYDGMIITGAPVEFLAYEEVQYWDELVKIMEWSKNNVYSTLHICWGAQAGLYYHYGIPKYTTEEKISGIYPHKVTYTDHPVKLFAVLTMFFTFPIHGTPRFAARILKREKTSESYPNLTNAACTRFRICPAVKSFSPVIPNTMRAHSMANMKEM